MKKFLLLILFCFPTTLLAAEWKTYELLNNQIFIDFPKSVKLKEDKSNKALLVNKSGLSKFSFNLTNTDADVKSITALHKAISAKYQSAFPNVKFSKDKVISKFETKAFIIEFENKSVSSKSYRIVYGLPVSGKLLLISYTSTEGKYKKKWRNIARSVFDTLETN